MQYTEIIKLLDAGYTREEIEKISYKNVLRVFRENFPC